MKDSNRMIAIWGITVIVVIGAALVLVVVLSGGDQTDMERQPDLVRPPAVASLVASLTGAGG